MEVIRGIAQVPTARSGKPGPNPTDLTVAIGNFDGVHLGHQEIFRQALASSSADTACVLTFDPHPAKILAPALAPPLLQTLEQRLEAIAEQKIPLCVVEPFTHALADTTPEAFVREILVAGLGARNIIVGEDFTYGQKRGGNVETLRQAGAQAGFTVTVVPKVTVNGLVVSSTKIRELVFEGRLDGAALLLGRPFELVGTVTKGEGRGRKLGFPTANLSVMNELLPANGVYAALAHIDSGVFRAVVNIGLRPTFGSESVPTVEAHVLDLTQDLYGQTMRLAFIDRLRPEVRFSGPDQLVAQIRADIALAETKLDSMPGGTRDKMPNTPRKGSRK